MRRFLFDLIIIVAAVKAAEGAFSWLVTKNANLIKEAPVQHDESTPVRDILLRALEV